MRAGHLGPVRCAPSSPSDRARLHVRHDRLSRDDGAVHSVACSLHRVRGVGAVVIDRTQRMVSVGYDEGLVSSAHVRGVIDAALGQKRAYEAGASPWLRLAYRSIPVLLEPMLAILLTVA